MKIKWILRPNTCNKLAYDFRINHFTQTKGKVEFLKLQLQTDKTSTSKSAIIKT